MWWWIISLVVSAFLAWLFSEHDVRMLTQSGPHLTLEHPTAWQRIRGFFGWMMLGMLGSFVLWILCHLGRFDAMARAMVESLGQFCMKHFRS